MKPSFHHRMINGPFEDPVVYIRLFWRKRAILFDAGDIWDLPAREINKVSDLFVTHTHIDHFIGFDRLLRILLRRDTPLNIFGPEGIRGAVEGKLRGYTWNLIEDYPVRLIVNEVRGGKISVVEYRAGDGFRPSGREERTNNGVLLKDTHFTIKSITLTHDIPVLAFSIHEDFHININREKLLDMGLPVGPWLSGFKSAVRRGDRDWQTEIQGREYHLGELERLITRTRGQKISYVVDISPTVENIEKVIPFVKDSDTLYIETYFLERDRLRAMERNHLTAGIAGEIAREANVKEMIPLHFSPKYRRSPKEVLSEAAEAFRAPAG